MGTPIAPECSHEELLVENGTFDRAERGNAPDASLGAGYKRYKPEVLIKSDAGEVLDRIEGEVESDAVATFAVNYEHSFTATTKITNKFLTEAGADNTAVQNDLALQVTMTETLALAVGYSVRYNSDPPPLSESTDTLTTINLVYNIK